MPKLRVYQLARELNRDNAEIIRELQHMGVPVTSHSNTVEDRLADRLRRELGVFVADGGKKASDGDEIVAIETPDEEVPAAVVEEAAKPEPGPPVIEAKAEPKIEEKPPVVEPKVAATPAPPPPQPAAPTAPPPQAAAPAPPKVAQTHLG